MIKHVDNALGLAKLSPKKIAPFAFSLIAGLIFISVMLQNDKLINLLLTVASIAILAILFGRLFVKLIMLNVEK